MAGALTNGMGSLDAVLCECGLSRKEASVYIALLELGYSTAARISKATGINRTTLYDVLAGLSRKGAAGVMRRGRALHFHATHPDALVDALRKRAEMLRRAVPALKARMNIAGAGPALEYYEGGNGIDAIYQRLLAEKKHVYGYGSFAIIERIAKYRTQDYRKRRVELGIPTTVVTDSSIEYLPLLRDARYRKLTNIFISPVLRVMPAWTYIVGTKVAVISCGKGRVAGFVIDDPAMAAKEHCVFKMLQQRASKLRPRDS